MLFFFVFNFASFELDHFVHDEESVVPATDIWNTSCHWALKLECHVRERYFLPVRALILLLGLSYEDWEVEGCQAWHSSLKERVVEHIIILISIEAGVIGPKK